MWPSRSRSLLFGAVAVMFVSGQPARAQTNSDPNLVHWAYAILFGTGVYRVGDSLDALVVRVPVGWTLSEADAQRTEGCRCGLRLLFPLTIGIQDFDFSEIVDQDLSLRVQQVSFVPGVRLEFPVSTRWTLRANAQVGWGTETGDGSESAWIYTAGVHARRVFPGKRFDPVFVSGYDFAGYEPSTGNRDSLSRLTVGIETAHKIGKRQADEALYLEPHAMGFFYFQNPQFPSFDEVLDFDLNREWELGLSVGRKQPFKLWWFKFDRIGLAYRFSDDGSGIRIVMNSIF